MSKNKSGAGRLVPASPLDFSRYAKNLAWLLECPLNFAQELLAACYGFANLHELQAALPQPGAVDTPTGPFDAPRQRPAFFPDGCVYDLDAPNQLTPLSPRELKLVRYSESAMHRRAEKEGRLRRRHYAVLDAAFFSAPSVHRKQFAAVKQGILAMEGTALERETYLCSNWPPSFWAYLEGTQMLPLDAKAGLSELKGSSIYFDESEIMGIANLFNATAAYRAPIIYLEMVGKAQEPIPIEEYDCDYSFFDELPFIGLGRFGLFDWDEGYFWTVVRDELAEEYNLEIPIEFHGMSIQDIAKAPPGVPAALVKAAGAWRLRQLRSLCWNYANSVCVNRYCAKSAEMYWPGSVGSTIHEKSEFVWEIARNAPSLMVYGELEEQFREENSEESLQTWAFKVLLTRTAPGEPEDVVGYMAGWLFDPTVDNIVCDEAEFAHRDFDEMLSAGITAFIKSYLTFNGHEDLVEFSNSRFSKSVVITEIVLRDKYKKKDLTPLIFTGLNIMLQESPYMDFPDGWKEWSDFNLDSDEDILDRPMDVYIHSPGVFMVPVKRENKRLRSYLMSVVAAGELDLDDDLDVFPFHYEMPDEEESED